MITWKKSVMPPGVSQLHNVHVRLLLTPGIIFGRSSSTGTTLIPIVWKTQKWFFSTLSPDSSCLHTIVSLPFFVKVQLHLPATLLSLLKLNIEPPNISFPLRRIKVFQADYISENTWQINPGLISAPLWLWRLNYWITRISMAISPIPDWKSLTTGCIL